MILENDIQKIPRNDKKEEISESSQEIILKKCHLTESDQVTEITNSIKIDSVRIEDNTSKAMDKNIYLLVKNYCANLMRVFTCVVYPLKNDSLFFYIVQASKI